ncbi:C2 domain-containing protein At1g53590 isoform X4 [Ziziphus jujuba]|uniref:C2 domain-containing protein At1g53590 isoform X4 n=1 Tax=Ziziphus jujuba TaxID=326968 RepID=A0ABM3I6D6_ZIZJJ|nr:C2 domain-containing protein At1g53590 isoform X4 [Ziziphus jujuba]
MDITEVSMIHHAGIVLFMLWLLSRFDCSYLVTYLLSLIYLFLVHERYVMRLRKKLQFEERKQANQKRVLSDSETVRWLNHAVEKIWPICMEQIVSQKILLPIIPWFLEKYKPWTVKKAAVHHLNMGRNPPVFTEMRVLPQSNDDDHLVLELGLNFLTADDMSAILAVQLRKRVGFGMSTKLHITGMHVEGKVLVGVKFLRTWPFLGRLRVCFVEPPYFQMTVKPIFTHGLDVTELPGIAGWLDKLLSIAFEQTLVEPNMLVVDMEKFISPLEEQWFSVNEKEPLAYARVEIIEASDMKPSDLNGLADPYVKGQLGCYRFKTKTQKKTLAPKWHEEFKMPIVTWESPNVLNIEVCDKDHFVDDMLGDCSINVGDFRTGQRHDIWLPLNNIKTGRLHVALTVIEKGEDRPSDWESFKVVDKRDSFASETMNKGSFSSVSSEKSNRVADNFEPINIEGQKETGIWVHQPGSEVSQTWEPRKGKSRRLDTEIQREPDDSTGSHNAAAPGPQGNDSSSDENPDDKRSSNRVRRGLKKIGSLFHRSPKEEDTSVSFRETVLSPHVNIKAVNEKDIGVRFLVEDNLAGPASAITPKDGTSSSGGSGPDSPGAGKLTLVTEDKSKDQAVQTGVVNNPMDTKGPMKKVSPEGPQRSLEKVRDPDRNVVESSQVEA